MPLRMPTAVRVCVVVLAVALSAVEDANAAYDALCSPMQPPSECNWLTYQVYNVSMKSLAELEIVAAEIEAADALKTTCARLLHTYVCLVTAPRCISLENVPENAQPYDMPCTALCRDIQAQCDHLPALREIALHFDCDLLPTCSGYFVYDGVA